MHAYVVNLSRSPERRQHMIAQLSKTDVDYEFVDAVDGRNLDLTDSALFDLDVVNTPTYRPGAAGCALSHLEIYHRIAESTLNYALILEDDVILPADLKSLASAAAQHMRGAEVVLLNFHSYEPCRVLRTGSSSLPASRLLVNLADERQVSSTGAYVITQEACHRMSRMMLPLRAQPDDWAFFRREGALDRVRCVVPMPVANSATLRTTIDHFEPTSLQARVRETVARAPLPVVRSALTRRRRRTFNRLGWTGRTVFVEESEGLAVRPDGSPQADKP